MPAVRIGIVSRLGIAVQRVVMASCLPYHVPALPSFSESLLIARLDHRCLEALLRNPCQAQGKRTVQVQALVVF